jgi:hypothetical protein
MAGDSKSRERLRRLYSKVMSAVDASGVDVILFYGTLLGLIRGGDFIEGDDDVDVLIAHRDLDALKLVVDKTEGLSGRTLGEAPRQLYQIYAGDVGPFDVYTYHVLNRTDVLVVWEAMIYSTNDIFPARRASFHGHRVLVPRNPHQLLSDTYGSGYMTPMSKGMYADSVTVRRCSDVSEALRAMEESGKESSDVAALSSLIQSIILVMLLAIALGVLLRG